MSSKYISNRIPLILFLIFGLNINLNLAYADQIDITNLYQQAENLKLSQNSVWLKLIHFDASEHKSEIVTKDFFLANDGRENPDSELKATIDAYFKHSSDGNQSARCLYPARYYWLNQELHLPNYHLHDKTCTDFESLDYLNKVKSISVLFVSGYYGNPASTFGHSLLKFNEKSQTDTELFDHTYSFAAKLPPGTGAIAYILRGLAGGFKGAFSDKYFYTEDMVYSKTEFRDIWDYQLNLTESEKDFLILHLWELQRAKFDYYFFNKNCAYRISEALNLVTGKNLLKNSTVWYAPVEAFHELIDADQKMKEKGPGLIKSVRFIPSAQRALYNQVSLMTGDEIDAMNKIIEENPKDLNEVLNGFSTDDKIHVLDSLLSYYQYKITSEQPSPSEELESKKNKVLLARLLLPISNEDKPKPIKMISPANSSPPAIIGLGYTGGNELNTHSYGKFYFVPYSYDVLSRVGGNHDELVVLKTVLGMNKTDGVFIDKLDLLKIRSLEAKSIPITGEHSFAWEVRLGADRLYYKDLTSRLDEVASFGIGKNFHMGLSSLYFMADLAWHDTTGIAVEPNVGLMYSGYGAFAMELSYRSSVDVHTRKNRDSMAARFEYRFNKKNALRLSINKNYITTSSIAYLHYW